MAYLVYGGKGWIGGLIVKELKAKGKTVFAPDTRIEDRESVLRDIEEYKPKFILNCAGKTGVPNVDWCEDHKQETIRSNIIGALTLADVSYLKGIHLTVFSTGCIYEYDNSEHAIGGKPFKEEDPPNFSGSFYSGSKIALEKLIVNYPNVLILRLRMPVSDDLSSSRNLISKLIKYNKVINIPNSMTILEDLLPISLDMTEKEIKGVFNFTNPGVISHNEILSLYKEYIDPNFTWNNFTIEEQAKVIKAPRSNNHLDTTKLESLYPSIPPIKLSIVDVFKRAQMKNK